MKYLVVYGTRPELIKLHPVIVSLISSGNDVVSYSTMQQSTILKQTEKSFGFSPDHSAPIRNIDYSLGGMWDYVFSSVVREISYINPGAVIVQGDTTTAAASAMAAFLSGVDVIHVEAGLRTHTTKEPFPEEAFRQIISRIAKIHFCPTSDSLKNLSNDGINMSDCCAFVVGNTELDSIQYVLDTTDCPDWISSDEFDIVTTIHRRESIGERMVNICRSLVSLGNDGYKIIMTVHPNPNVAKIIMSEMSNRNNIRLLSPVDFTSFVHMLARTRIVITDSGGVQEDCSYLGIPVIVARNVTDRQEAIDAGGAIIGGIGDNIHSTATSILNNKERYDIMSKSKCPFGDGNSSQLIVRHLTDIYG